MPFFSADQMRAALAAQVPQPAAVPEAPALDWPQMLLLINAYAGHVADAAQHQAASRADISQAAALKALTNIRMAMAAHTSRWQALVHELIWRASPGASPQPAAPTGHRQGCDALGGYGHGIGPCTCGFDAPPAALAVPDRWVLVPVEPTEAMCAAGRDWAILPHRCYRAMLSAAPPQAHSTPGQDDGEP